MKNSNYEYYEQIINSIHENILALNTLQRSIEDMKRIVSKYDTSKSTVKKVHHESEGGLPSNLFD